MSLEGINVAVSEMVRSIDDLAALAQSVNSSHAAGEQSSRQGLRHFHEAGEALIRAKAHCKHGQWLPWLKANVHCSKSQAYRYMTLAKLPVTGNLVDEWRIISGNESAAWHTVWDRAGVSYLAATGEEAKAAMEEWLGTSGLEGDECYWNEFLIGVLVHPAARYLVSTGKYLPPPIRLSEYDFVDRKNDLAEWQIRLMAKAGGFFAWLEAIGITRKRGGYQWPDPPPPVDALKDSLRKRLKENCEEEEYTDDTLAKIFRVSQEDLSAAVTTWARGYFLLWTVHDAPEPIEAL